MTMPINSAICVPFLNEHVVVKKSHPVIEVKGWAIGDGADGGKINKVEISLDGGQSW